MAWTSFILLSCLVVAAASQCPKLFACEKPIRDEGIFAETGSLIFKIDDKKTLDSICGKVPTLKSCVAKELPTCSSHYNKQDVNHFRDIMEYICTPEGKKAALATTKTACVMNPDLNIWFIYHVLYDCEWDFYDDLFAAITKKGSSLTLAESCSLKIKMDTCVKSKMDTKCGPEMAAMIEQMWRLWVNYEYTEYTTCGKTTQGRKRRNLGAAALGSRWSSVSNSY